MDFYSFYHFVFIFWILNNNSVRSLPQNFDRILLNQRNVALQPNRPRQGSIDEFLALRPTTQKPTKSPCIPQQFYPGFNFIHSKKKPVYPVAYRINVYEQNNNNKVPKPTKLPYNAYGGYYCGQNIPIYFS